MYTFTVTINKPQITADVRNDTHKFGKGRDNGALSLQQVSNLQADDLAQDSEIVNTAINSSIERIVSALSKHIEGIAPGKEVVEVTFKMSRFYTPVSDAAVQSGITDFVRAMAIYEYLKLVAPNDSMLYFKQAEQHLTEVKSALNYKKWRTQSA